MDKSVFQAYVHSGDFLSALRLPAGTELDFSLLGQGEYNVNYSFRHPETGQRLVLRLNNEQSPSTYLQMGMARHGARRSIPAAGPPAPSSATGPGASCPAACW